MLNGLIQTTLYQHRKLFLNSTRKEKMPSSQQAAKNALRLFRKESITNTVVPWIKISLDIKWWNTVRNSNMEPEKMIISKSISRVLGFGFWVYSFYHRWQDALLPHFCDNCCRSSAFHFLPWSNYAATRRWSRETWMAIQGSQALRTKISQKTPCQLITIAVSKHPGPFHGTSQKWIFWVALRKKKTVALNKKNRPVLRKNGDAEWKTGGFHNFKKCVLPNSMLQLVDLNFITDIYVLFLGALLTRQKGNCLGFMDRHPGIPNGS